MNTEFFQHSVDASSEGRLNELLNSFGAKGYGIYWYLVEQIHTEGGKITLNDIETYAETLQVPCEDIVYIIKNYALFSVTGPFVHLPNAAYGSSCAGIWGAGLR